MSQDIIVARPPNYFELATIFPIAETRGVIFSWGDKIYNPDNVRIEPSLLAHEAVHGRRQLARGVERWWEMYGELPEFRLEEELPAHIAEYRALCATTKDRNLCARHRSRVAHRLAGTLYGAIITPSRAFALLK